ncbi:hypothetical protein RCU67_13595, partial [Escherichia coli]|nr:hypothetical protein [Escherichia coli]
LVVWLMYAYGWVYLSATSCITHDRGLLFAGLIDLNPLYIEVECDENEENCYVPGGGLCDV